MLPLTALLNPFQCLQGSYLYAGLPQHPSTPVGTWAITMADDIVVLVLNPAGTLLAGTVTLPPNPEDNDKVEIVSTQIITTLTVNANTGQTISGGGALAIGVNSGMSWRYAASLTKWFRRF